MGEIRNTTGKSGMHRPLQRVSAPTRWFWTRMCQRAESLYTAAGLVFAALGDSFPFATPGRRLKLQS